MSQARPQGGKDSGGALAVTLLLGVILLPILYCAGLGPAIWLVNHASVPADVFEVIYAPLEIIYDRFEVLQPIFDAYIRLWE